MIGLGYVGLPLALLFEESGFPVVGFDVDPEKPRALHAGASYIRHIGPERVATAFRRGRICATSDFADLAECDAVLVCVPAPLGRHREPDLSYIRSTADRDFRDLTLYAQARLVVDTRNLVRPSALPSGTLVRA